MKVVVIDPRKTETCTIADLHLAIKPGSDVALFNDLLRFANKQERIDKASVGRFADGLDEALESASAPTLSEVAKICDVDASSVKTFMRFL